MTVTVWVIVEVSVLQTVVVGSTLHTDALLAGVAVQNIGCQPLELVGSGVHWRGIYT